MSTIVTLTQINQQLRDPPVADSDELTAIGERATVILLDFLKVDSTSYQDSNGDPQDVPPLLVAACLMIAQRLYDGLDPIISDSIKDLVRRYRDPALQ